MLTHTENQGRSESQWLYPSGSTLSPGLVMHTREHVEKFCAVVVSLVRLSGLCWDRVLVPAQATEQLGKSVRCHDFAFLHYSCPGCKNMKKEKQKWNSWLFPVDFSIKELWLCSCLASTLICRCPGKSRCLWGLVHLSTLTSSSSIGCLGRRSLTCLCSFLYGALKINSGEPSF